VDQQKLQGYPRGWFVVAFAAELAPGTVLPMTYFGQRLVAYRTEAGRPVVLSAYCPHLGADLGVGGKVVGDTLQCPFHAWRFGPTGRCVDIPYATKIPAKACVTPWRVDERNGLVFVWHDPSGGEPDWRIPEIPEYGRPDWTPWHGKRIEIKTHPREIVENVVDIAHFPEVHGTHVTRFENEFDGHVAVQRTEGIAYPRGGGEDPFKLTATYYGPAYQITAMESMLPNRLLNCHTPIGPDLLHLRFGVMIKVARDATRTEAFVNAYVENLRIGFFEDVQIWEHKKWRDRPTLCDGDGAFGKLRKWYRQFYQPVDARGLRAGAPLPTVDSNP
jgi:3-ketosteroid 9alpha-monooxygenase subunit A